MISALNESLKTYTACERYVTKRGELGWLLQRCLSLFTTVIIHS